LHSIFWWSQPACARAISDTTCPGLKNISDAETIRAKILGAFELAATTEDEGERARQMTFILVGAGPTGVELAGPWRTW
jgi:NADH dehydrogenase FAD-containing subunit